MYRSTKSQGSHLGPIDRLAPSMWNVKSNSTDTRQSQVNKHTEPFVDEPRRRREQVSLLLELVGAIGRASELSGALGAVAAETARACGVHRCSILLWRDDKLVPAVTALAAARADDCAAAFAALGPFSLDDVPACARALRERGPVFAHDPAGSGLLPAAWIAALGERPTVVLPLVLGDRMLGTMHLDGADGPIARAQLWPTEAIAGPLALAIDHARLSGETRRRLHEKNRLLRVALTINSTLDVQEVLRRIARESARAVGADTGAIYFLGDDARLLQPLVGYHVPKRFLETVQRGRISLDDFRDVVTLMSQERRSIWSDDVARDPSFDHELFRRLPMRSLFITPIVLGSKTLGVLVCVWWAKRHRFDAESLALLEGIAGLAGVALSNARRYSQAEVLAVTRERLRVARELHDTLNETIFSTALKLDACCREVPADQPALRATLEEVKRNTGNIMSQMRQLIYRVAPRPIGALKLSERVRSVIDAAAELSDVAIELIEQGDAERLDGPRQETLLKIVQEALANIVKHARARRAEIRLDVLADEVRFAITDDGVGARPPLTVETLPHITGHFGLRQMLERLEVLDGTLELGNLPSGGFRVAGRFPIGR